MYSARTAEAVGDYYPLVPLAAAPQRCHGGLLRDPGARASGREKGVRIKLFRIALGLLPLTLVALSPAAASAGTGNGEIYEAAAGEVNNIVASGNGTGVTITDTAGATASTSCTQINATTISCLGGRFTLKLGDQNDTFSYGGGALPPSGVINPLEIDGGAGSDKITGSPYPDALHGDDTFTRVPDPSGNDTILGNDGDDQISDSDGTSNAYDGGSGSDRFSITGTGQNTLSGGPGDDIMLGGDGPETLSGGDGNDDMNGGPGTDNVLGEGGNDSLEGGDDEDISDGGPGRDVLGKGFHAGGCRLVANLDGGPDTMIGGPGIDRVAVSCNTPILKLRDGEADTGFCAQRVTSAVKEYDKKLDLIEGGACATLICKKKKKKKGKKRSASTAMADAAKKKGKKKKKKCKPYKAPEDTSQFAAPLGAALTLTRP